MLKQTINLIRPFNKYAHVWLISATFSIQSSFEQRLGAVMFIIGKIIRFSFFLILILLIGDRVNQATGYTTDQMIIFFLFFNFFDIFGQTFFRGIYWFREQIISREFDFRLIKPMNPLFQALTRQTDILDLPVLALIIFIIIKRSLFIPPANLFTFLLLTLCGLAIVTAIHIAVAALGIITSEIDHTIMIYRDLSSMARVPVDIYSLPIRGFITFVLPIGIAYTFPAKAFLGILPFNLVVTSVFISLVFLLLSLKFWNLALTKYSSASS